MLLIVAALSLTGCLRAQISLAVSDDDRVSGQIVVAVPKQSPGGASGGPKLTVPSTLVTKVRAEDYSEGDFVGTRVFLSDLTFTEFSQLSELSGDYGNLLELSLKRAGDEVAVNAKADLRELPPEGPEITIRIAFPDKVGDTDGTREDDSVATWKLDGGELNTVRADTRYSDPKARGFIGWTVMVFILALVAAAGVAGMAYLYRNPRPSARAVEGQRQENFLTEVNELRDRVNNSAFAIRTRMWFTEQRERLRGRGKQ